MMNNLMKYIIVALFAVIIIISILLIYYVSQNKRLERENTRLTEMVALRDAAISEVDKNIASLQEQVLEAESICNERLKARVEVHQLFSNPPNFAQDGLGVKAPTVLNKKVVSNEKSNIAIDSINRYWVQFTLTSDSKK